MHLDTIDRRGPELRERLLAGIPVAERRLTAAGLDTPVLEGGTGTPLVLLHGPGGSGAHWWRVLPALTAAHAVVAPDLPGQGAPLPPALELDDAHVLRWLGELIEQTCPSPPVIVGNALGGAIAARFAAERPEQVAQLVLVDALGLTGFAPAPDFGAALHAFLAAPGEATHDALWRRCALDLPALRERIGDAIWETFATGNVIRARTPGVLAALGGLMEGFALPAIPEPVLAGIGAPTTLVWGRSDLATPLAVAEAAADRHGWPLYVIDGAADDPPVEQPEAFVRAVHAAVAGAAVLAPAVRGGVLEPGDDGFGAATDLWNGAIGVRPALVVKPTGAADVVAALAHARARRLPVAVRGRGHNIAGRAVVAGGLTLDMAGLSTVTVDPEARTATVAAGCALGDVDRETQLHGLATPLGFISGVGVGGLTLGGGLGYLSRRFGWTVDNLLEVEIVTGDGCVRRAGREREPELFWGVRGGGAHLGVVTSFTFRLHAVGPTVFGGLIAWPFARAAEVLAAYRELTLAAPRELAVWHIMLRAPAAPFVPLEWQGERVCAMAVCHSGSDAAGLAPLRALGEPVFDLLREQPYTELQSYLDATEPRGSHYHWRTEYAAELSDDLLDTLRELAADCPIADGQIGCLALGGAIADHADDDGAVGNRDARYALGANGGWEPGDPSAEAHRRWVRAAGDRLRPFGTGATYVNFQSADEGPERLAAAYGANLDRLRALKRRFDPDGLLRPLP